MKFTYAIEYHFRTDHPDNWRRSSSEHDTLEDARTTVDRLQMGDGWTCRILKVSQEVIWPASA